MKEPESILVCRLSSLGDIVLALPAVNALRQRFPSAHLAVLAGEPHGRILTGLSEIDALHLWPGRGAGLPAGVAARTWDLVVDLSGTGRSRRLLRAVRARRRTRIAKQTLRRLAFVKLRRLGFGSVGILPAVTRMFSALAPLDIAPPEDVRPRLPAPPPVPGGPVLLAPGGGRDAKRWPADRFAAIAAELVARGLPVLLLGTQAEKELLEEIAGAWPAEKGRVVAGADPATLPGMIGPCRAGLTNDSGLAHVAEACGVPVVVLFGPTHPRLGFAPLDPHSLALHTGIDCSPCDLHGPNVCPKGHHRCLTELTVEQVLAELLALAA
jgi:heptosyltransferase-2